MERGSDKHGPLQDDEIKEDLDGMMRADRPTRADASKDVEPPDDDDPAVYPFSEAKGTEPEAEPSSEPVYRSESEP